MVRSGVEATAHAVTFACQQCGAALAFAGVRTEICPYCASPNFVERPASSAQPDPAFVVPFTGDHAWARGRLARWVGARRLYADSALSAAQIEAIRGVYLPAYLYSAVARTDYTAAIGEHYTETETRTVEDKDGNKTTEQHTVTRTEYRQLAGHHVGYVTDVIVSASAGLDHATLARVQPFDLRQLRRFTPALVSGWIQEEFSRDADACRRTSRGEAIDDVGTELRGFMPGDGHCDLEWRTSVEWESFDPILVPVWVLAVRYRADRPALRVVVNGQTGAVSGKVPLSWWKVTLWALLASAIVAAIVVLVMRHRG